MAIVCNFDQLAAILLEPHLPGNPLSPDLAHFVSDLFSGDFETPDLNVACSCVQRVFKQLLDRRCKVQYDLTGEYAMHDRAVNQLNLCRLRHEYAQAHRSSSQADGFSQPEARLVEALLRNELQVASDRASL